MPGPGHLVSGRSMRCARSWLAAAVLALGLAGCGSSGPAALSVHCSGRDLTVPDSAEVDANDPVLPPPLGAVPGVPRTAGSATGVTVPDALDPGDPADGYSVQGWRVSRITGTGGQQAWSLTLGRPRGVPAAEPDLNLLPHYGYVIATGGNQGQFIAAVSSQGRAGPVCSLPPFAATDRPVELLPHAGVVILANPTESSTASGSYSVDGYSTATGKRLWSVSSDTSLPEGRVDFLVDHDTLYVWQGRNAQIAAYNAATGQHLWTADPGSTDPYDSPNGLLAAAGGAVYAITDTTSFGSSRVIALRGTNGKLMWRRTVPAPRSTSGEISVNPVGQDALLLSGNGEEDYLLNATTGATLAAQKLTARPMDPGGPPQICDPGGHASVAVTESGLIHVLSSDPADDKTIAIPPGASTSVVVTGTIAYVRQPKSGAPVYGYDLTTGKLAWTARAPGKPAGDNLYAFAGGFAVGAFHRPGQFTGTLYR